MMIAATALLASCGSKTTEEVTSEVETAVEETPVEEVPQLEEIEEVVEDSTETSGN